MTQDDSLLQRFEANRPHLQGVAYRLLGSLADAEDALQESWLRISRADTSNVQNLTGWLTTVVSRVCLNMLQSRKTRREDSIEVHMPDPIVSNAGGIDPEQEALLADSVGLALQVVLGTLAPAERLAFVLHDVFAVSFDEIAPIVGKTPTAARQLASRARRRVHVAAPVPDTELVRQREAVDAFFAAARNGDFDALVAVLDPDVVLRADGGLLRADQSVVLRGAGTIASQALMFARFSPFVRPALVNGAAGVVVAPNGHVFSVMGFTVVEGKIVAIDALVDPERLRDIDLTVLDG